MPSDQCTHSEAPSVTSFINLCSISFVLGWKEDDPMFLVILYTHHICLPNSSTTCVFIQHCQFYYRYRIPIVDLTADIILTKLENLVEWVCLIQFLTEMLKDCSPAPSYSLPCSFNDRVEQKISELGSQRNLSSSNGLDPSDQKNKTLTPQKAPAPGHLSMRADQQPSCLLHRPWDLLCTL